MAETLLKAGTAPQFWVEVAGLDPFKVYVRYMSPSTVKAIAEKATKTKLNKESRQMERVQDAEEYSKLMCRAMVVDWEGLTVDVLDKMMPLDHESREAIAALEGGLPFGTEELDVLVENTYSTSFMNQVIEIATDLQVMREVEKARLGNS